jgi:glycosyltransferase involved in cell wall biosynthesis|tara:strand:- start:1494 stop:2555 length:1062 start_codon:yes stop_codon:yes gene_type:complete
MKKIFIIIPSFIQTGPIKGAVALANYLVKYRNVTIVTVKNDYDVMDDLDKRVMTETLGDSKNIFSQIIAYKRILRGSGSRKDVASISLCFSADFVNLFCKKEAFTCASIRGNLINIYRMDYGIFGLPVAIIHLISLFQFDEVVSMSNHMRKQIKFYSRKESKVIGNFIDEFKINKFKNKEKSRNDIKKFIFVGSVSKRKNPILLLNTLKKIHDLGHNISLDILGDGPLMKSVLKEIELLNLKNIVKVHGHVSSPYKLISESSVFVLPSESEGISRASLEALHLGIPCVLRNIEGNYELIEDGVNGFLFNRDNDLLDAMMKAMNFCNPHLGRESLLPRFYRQEKCGKAYLELLE